jgi:hypothetical protein
VSRLAVDCGRSAAATKELKKPGKLLKCET